MCQKHWVAKDRLERYVINKVCREIVIIMQKPIGLQNIIATYGNKLLLYAEFHKHLTTVKTCPLRNFPKGIRIYCHSLLSAEIQNIFIEIAAAEVRLDKVLIKSYDGCYVNRPMRTDNTKLSCHAFGIAIDVNAATNRLGAKPCQSQALVDIFINHGWTWGGYWRRPDGMHFQSCSGY